MFCPKCSGDKFRVIDVYREKRFIEGRGWVINVNYDTRRVLCRSCGRQYLEESRIAYTEEFSNNRIKIVKTKEGEAV